MLSRFPALLLVIAVVPMLLLSPVHLRSQEARDTRETPPEVFFPRSELTIETARGATHRFTVELATSSEQHQRGLMFRDTMAQSHGMLFVFDISRPLSFWMRNTRISLDMLFLDAQGRVINIARRTTPMSEAAYRSAGPARAVLEINGGLSDLLGIAPGDRVLHSLLSR